MSSFQSFLCTVAVFVAVCAAVYAVGFKDGLRNGIKEGAELQKNGQLTWHTNSTLTVSFTVNNKE